MNYNPEYQEWVERQLKRPERELHEVYRGIPVFRLKVSDDPVEYHFRAPIVKGRIEDIDTLHEMIDRQLDEPPSSHVKASRRGGGKLDKDEATYFHKWQDCRVELEDMKRREAKMLAEVEKLRGRVEEISSARMLLEKDVTDLRSQVKEYEEIVADLEKKDSRESLR